MHKKSTQWSNEENSLKVNQKKKQSQSECKWKEIEIKYEKSKVFKNSWEIAYAIPRW